MPARRPVPDRYQVSKSCPRQARRLALLVQRRLDAIAEVAALSQEIDAAEKALLASEPRLRATGLHGEWLAFAAGAYPGSLGPHRIED